MKRGLHALSVFLIVFAMAFGLTPVRANADDQKTDAKETGDHQIQSFEEADPIIVKQGESVMFEASPSPADYRDDEITWSVDRSYKGYDSSRYIDVEGKGNTVKITGKNFTYSDSNYAAWLTATTKNGIVHHYEVHVFGESKVLTVSPYYDELKLASHGEPIRFEALSGVSGRNLPDIIDPEIRVEDPSVAVVEDGYLKPLNAGTTKVIVTAGSQRHETTVHVIDGQMYQTIDTEAERFKLDFDKHEMVTLRPVVSPENAEDDEIRWYNSNEDTVHLEVAEDGRSAVVTPLKGGFAGVKAVIGNGHTAYYNIDVDRAPESLTISGPDRFNINDNVYDLDIYSYIEPESSTSSSPVVSYSIIAGNDVAEIQRGYIESLRIKKAGTFTLQAEDESGLKAQKTFTVYDPSPATEIHQDFEARTIHTGSWTMLTVNYGGEEEDWLTDWTVDRPDIIELEDDWFTYPVTTTTRPYNRVKALKSGTATVTATSRSNPSLKASFRINVEYGEETGMVDSDLTAGLAKCGAEMEDPVTNASRYVMLVGKEYRVITNMYFYEFNDMNHMQTEAPFQEFIRDSAYLKDNSRKDSPDVLMSEPGENSTLDVRGWFRVVPQKAGSEVYTDPSGRKITFVYVDLNETEPKIILSKDSTAEEKRAADLIRENGIAGFDKAAVKAASSSVITSQFDAFIQKVPAGEKLKVNVQPRVSNVKIREDDGKKTLHMDITPVYSFVTDKGTKLSDEAVYTGKMGAAVLTVPVGDIFDDAGTDRIWVKHTTGKGEVFLYEGKLKDGAVTFTNPDGYSPFTFSVEKPDLTPEKVETDKTDQKQSSSETGEEKKQNTDRTEKIESSAPSDTTVTEAKGPSDSSKQGSPDTSDHSQSPLWAAAFLCSGAIAACTILLKKRCA